MVDRLRAADVDHVAVPSGAARGDGRHRRPVEQRGVGAGETVGVTAGDDLGPVGRQRERAQEPVDDQRQLPGLSAVARDEQLAGRGVELSTNWKISLSGKPTPFHPSPSR